MGSCLWLIVVLPWLAYGDGGGYCVSRMNCHYHGTCSRSFTLHRVCHCSHNWQGPYCERMKFYPYVPKRLCEQNLCAPNGICEVFESSGVQEEIFQCICRKGMTGKLCQMPLTQVTKLLPVNPCLSNPCGFNGKCFVDIYKKRTSFKCMCWRGYKGQRCQLDSFGYPLPPGYGELHESQIWGPYIPERYPLPNQTYKDPCESHPCQFRGACFPQQVNGQVTYRCECFHGYLGTNCDIPGYGVYAPGAEYDPCKVFKPCGHRGSCSRQRVDKMNGFKCRCGNYIGRYCEIPRPAIKNWPKNLCSPNPCAPFGKCRTRVLKRVMEYECICQQGHHGLRCEKFGDVEPPVDPCLSNPCRNNGSCVSLLFAQRYRYHCECLENYRGTFCEKRIMFGRDWKTDPCRKKPCGVNGICTSKWHYEKQKWTFQCSCKKGFSGKKCKVAEIPVDLCAKKNICFLIQNSRMIGGDMFSGQIRFVQKFIKAEPNGTKYATLLYSGKATPVSDQRDSIEQHVAKLSKAKHKGYNFNPIPAMELCFRVDMSGHKVIVLFNDGEIMYRDDLIRLVKRLWRKEKISTVPIAFRTKKNYRRLTTGIYSEIGPVVIDAIANLNGPKLRKEIIFKICRPEREKSVMNTTAPAKGKHV